MKMVLFLIFVSTLYAAGQTSGDRVYQSILQHQAEENAEMQREFEAEAAQKARQIAIEQHAALIKQTLQTFPWRTVDGVTQHVAVTWCAFSGRIQQMHPGEGARIDGEYHVIYPEDGIVFRGEFFVKNYPYKQADDDVVPSCLAAVPTDVYTYNTAQGSVHSIHALDFGIPCDAPPEIALEEQKKEAEATVAAEKKKAQSELRALKDNEDDAAKGDVYGLLRMGERYRDGEGVEKNLDKARDYLSRAAQAGDLTAKEELETLPKTATAASN